MLRSFLAAFFISTVFASPSVEPAWNGHVTAGSTTPSFFTPFWVPEGGKSYDSASPLINYSGRWIDSYSAAYIRHSIRSTVDDGASVSFTFTGSGIEWFGATDRTHGIAQVIIDGEHVEDVDAWSERPHKQQRIFWKFDLKYGKHTIKIVNTSRHLHSRNAKSTVMSLDALVVVKGQRSQASKKAIGLSSPSNRQANEDTQARPVMLASNPDQEWSLEQQGSTGVNAMQLAIISTTHALIVDKVEHNPLTVNGHPAWAALYNLKTHAVKPLAVQSNSFCAGGTFLSNGTLINVGGNAVIEGFTSSADFGNLNGLQSIRVFEPCDSENVEDCELYEHHSRIRMASPRWYNTVLRISDGSAMIIGGSKRGGWINNSTVNNPTLEYFPPKSIHGSNGLPIPLPFLVDTLNSNLFPIAFSLPDGTIFMAANRDAMIYDWTTNTERRLPQFPNGVRVTYPMAASAVLLPLSSENNYAPEILVCGGSAIDDQRPSWEISAKEPASSQCSRMMLTEEGISNGWQVEQMPVARHMPDAVLLPTGQVLIVNGAGTGVSGYGNVKHQVGASNADEPVLTPVLYDPRAPPGQRFSTAGLKTSSIPRMYHSVATLTPEGSIMIAGSNPNLDRSMVAYGTEYRVEWMRPPYMRKPRPSISERSIKQLNFGETVRLPVMFKGISSSSDIKGMRSAALGAFTFNIYLVALMDLGYITHAVHANSRLVYLACSHETNPEGDLLKITGPPNGKIYPPGPGFLYVIIDGVPSSAVKIMIGTGRGPTVDHDALDK